jgi:hypothetical protein
MLHQSNIMLKIDLSVNKCLRSTDLSVNKCLMAAAETEQVFPIRPMNNPVSYIQVKSSIQRNGVILPPNAVFYQDSKTLYEITISILAFKT